MALPRLTGWCNLASAPQIYRAEQGGRVRAVLRVAFNHRWTDRDKKEHKETTWLNCVAWGQTAAQMEAAKLVGGARIHVVEGRLKQEERLDDNGQRQISFELVIHQFAISPPRV